MKQQIIELKKKLLLVEIGGELSDEFIEIINKYGMAEILGKLTDIKEEQFAQWVEKWEGNQFQDYVLFRGHLHNCVDTAKESFFSKLEAEGIYFENPLWR